jgi:hypothetical protein
MPITNVCPSCGADRLEMAFALEVENVHVDTDVKPSWKGGETAFGTVVDFKPGTGDGYDNGVVTMESDAFYFQCADCGWTDSVDVSREFASRWRYVKDVAKLGRVLNTCMDALHYVLDNDTDYVSGETEAEWQRALDYLIASDLGKQ